MTGGRSILLPLLIVAAIGNSGFSDETITLPLQGYFHVGRYMPVRIASAKDGQLVQGSGIIPVRIQTFLPPADRVVPVLMTSVNASLAAPVQLHPLDAQQLLVGLVGSASEAEARRLFPGRDIIPIHLDWPLAEGGFAWNALDGIVIADAPAPDDATKMRLLGAGVTFAVRSDAAPDARWPWRREGEFWTLRYEPLGPRDCFADPSALLASYSPRLSFSSRCNAVLLAAIFVILVIGATLLPRKWRLIGIVGVVAGSLVALSGWMSAQSRICSAEGEIFITSPGLLQQDFWSCQGALRPALARMNGGDVPMLTDWSGRAAMGMTLVWETDKPNCYYEYRASAGAKMAFLLRIVMPLKNPSFPINHLHRSPLRPLVDDLYLRNGAHIVGEGLDHPTTFGAMLEHWPEVIIDRPGSTNP